MRGDGTVTVPDAEYVEMVRHLRHYREMPWLVDAALAAQRRVDEAHWLAVEAERHAFDPAPMPGWKLAIYVGSTAIAGALIGIAIGYTSGGGVTVVNP